MSYVWQRWMPREFRAAGLKVIEVAGWENRGRPASTGNYDPDEGDTVHHTGSRSSATTPAPSLQLLITGRSDLPGPLCQYATAYDGTIYVIAAGRCNHAGAVGKSGVPGMPLGADGNALALGNEVMTDGTQVMPANQRRAVVLSTAVVLAHQGHDAIRAHRHADISGSGKWDLGSMTTAELRRETAAAVVKLLAPPPEPTPNITAVFDAGTTDQRKRALGQVVEHGDPPAARVAERWLRGFRLEEEGRGHVTAARAALRDLEVK